MCPMRYNISTESPRKAGNTDSYDDNLDLDVLIIGAGFGGVYLLKRIRDELGLKVKAFEAGKDFGGVWYWNVYPGACVDSPVPCVYELSFPEVWKDWYWPSTYPTWKDLRGYFKHATEKLDVRKDVAFESRVNSCEYDKETNKWTVKTEDGRTARCTYLIAALGFAAKRNFPQWKGLDDFEGVIQHASFWPEEGIPLEGKRVAVVGCGATGNQLVQTVGKVAGQLTLFQRTPNLGIPMRRKPMTKEQQDDMKGDYPRRFKDRMQTFAGFDIDFAQKNTFDDTPEEREKFYEELWEKGGFNYWLANYKDMLFDLKANDEAYKFWRKKTLPIVTDPRKQKILVPEKPPHPFGTKRPCLSEGYFEALNEPRNDVVDINDNPVVEVQKKGILTKDGKLREFDIIILATGFDGVTGGMMDMGLKDVNGVPVKEKWKKTTRTYLGLTTSDYPNYFFLYGPQGPTAFGNGPSTVELQGTWIINALTKLKKQGITYLAPKKEKEEEYAKTVNELSDKTLFPLANSWYMGAYSAQKEQLNFPGGFPMYADMIQKEIDSDFSGFEKEPPKA